MSLQLLYRHDWHWAFCHTCKLKHPIPTADERRAKQGYADWCERHPEKLGCRTALMTPAQVEKLARRHERRRRKEHLRKFDYAGNSDVKIAYQSEQTQTTTNLQSLASSATAGWGGNSVDNTSNLYLDYGVQMAIAAVNTAPGNNQATYLYAFSGDNSSDLTTTGTSGGTVGTEGTLTFPDITTLPVVMPLIGIIPYPVQNKAIVSRWFSIAKSTDGIMAPYWGVAVVNYTGMTYAAAGNTIKHRGVYSTVI